MNLKIAFLFLFVLITANLKAELSFSPVHPKAGQKVEFTYSNEGRFKDSDILYLYLYCFNSEESFPAAYQLKMQKVQAAKYSATFDVPDKSVFVLIKAGTETEFDTKYRRFWDFTVNSQNGKPVRNAYFRMALSFMGNLAANCSRNIDFNQALSCLNREVTEHPDNLVAKIAVVSLKHDLKQISSELFNESIKSLYDPVTNVSDENTAIGFIRALRAINENEKAEELENKFISTHPAGKLAEDKELNALQKAGSFEDFKSGALDFIKKYPNSGVIDKVWLALLKAYDNESKFDEFKEFIKSEQKVSPSVYAEIAMLLISQKSTNEQKIDGEVNYFFNKAMDSYKYDLGNQKPVYLTPSEWDQQKNVKLAKILMNFADALSDDGRFVDANDTYLKAKSLLGDNADYDLYDAIIHNFIDTDNKESAFNNAREAIATSNSSTFSDSVFKEFYYRYTNSQKGYEIYLDSLTVHAKELRLKDLENELLNEKANFDEVLTSDGIKIELEEFAGKSLVLNFWSTWCEPCKSAFPAIDKLDKLYKDNNVAIIAMNIWEKSDKRKKNVKNFIAENDIDIPVYIDSKNKLPLNLGVTGLPARVFIDKNGIVRFKDYGFDGEEKLIRDSEDKIEFLQKKLK